MLLDYNHSKNELFTLGADKHVTIWSLVTNRVEAQLTTEDFVSTFTISPDSQLTLVGTEQGEMKLYTSDDARLIHFETAHAAPITAVAFSPDNTLILTADATGHIFFWRIK